eukprot:m.13263 g.13263  ORF g.13263 m.13263 type:complete len:672 (-) comp10078_c0_seq2:319-2334(-)
MSGETTAIGSPPSRWRSTSDHKKSPGSPLKKRKGELASYYDALRKYSTAEWDEVTTVEGEEIEPAGSDDLAADVKKILQGRAAAAVTLSTPQQERYPADKRRTPAAVQSKGVVSSAQHAYTPRSNDDTTSRKRLSLSGVDGQEDSLQVLSDPPSREGVKLHARDTPVRRSARGAAALVSGASAQPMLSTPDKFPHPSTASESSTTQTSMEKLLTLARGSPPRSPQRSERLRKSQMLAPVLKTQGGRLLAQTLAASPKKAAPSPKSTRTAETQHASTPTEKGKVRGRKRLPMPQKFLDLVTKFREFDRTVCHARKMSQRTFSALQTTVQKRTHKDFTLYDLGQICAVLPHVYSLERLIVEKSPQLVVNNVLDAAGAVVGPGDRVSRTINLQPRLNDFCDKLEHRVKEHIANTMNEMFAQSSADNISQNVSADSIKRPPPGFDPEDVPDISPAAMPEARKATTNRGVEVLVSPHKSTSSASAALTPPSRTTSGGSSAASADDTRLATGTTAAANTDGDTPSGALKGVSSSLLERIRRKQGKRQEQKAAVFTPHATLINDLTHVLSSVAFFVWGRKPATGRMGIRFATFAADLRRKNANLGTLTQCKQLLCLMIDEVGRCQQTTEATAEADRWCYVKTIVEDRTAVEYIQIQATFNLTEFKAHLESRIAALRQA